jgi:N utilization substance protein A
MSKIKLDTESIRYMTLFENVTKAMVKDCIPSEDKIIFVVREGFAGVAIGKNGTNIKNLENMLKRKIEIVEFSDDPIKFLTNVLRPFDMKNAYVSEKSDGKKVMYFSVNKSGPLLMSKIKKARKLVERYFGEMDLLMS